MTFVLFVLALSFFGLVDYFSAVHFKTTKQSTKNLLWHAFPPTYYFGLYKLFKDG